MSDFYKDKRAACKQCIRKYNAKHCSTKAHKEYKKDYDAKRRATKEYKEYIQKYRKEYQESEQGRATINKYNAKCRTTEEYLAKRREYEVKRSSTETRKACKKKSNAKRYASEAYRIYSREYIRERYHNDIEFRLLQILRKRVYCSLKGKGTKSDKTINLVGCSVIFLKQYLEGKFKEGMSWDNHGKKGWEIDHIKPCASFKLIEKEEQHKCFHYTNLQPLWAIDNQKKGAKIL
ncbi:MAG TPA: hypothetical protein VMV86_00205 [Methanosarcinales archaeon]|nr:hypothetical protein [Methanosarcinales archaeon]